MTRKIRVVCVEKKVTTIIKSSEFIGEIYFCPLFCSSAIWFMSDILYYISIFFQNRLFSVIKTKACQTYIKCRCQLHVKNVVWYNYLDETVEGLARCFFLNLSTDFGKWKANTADHYDFPFFKKSSCFLCSQKRDKTGSS